MVSDLRDADTGVWISVQYFAYEVLAFGGQELRHLVVSTHDLFIQVRCLRILKWQVASNHSVENNSGAPNISLKSVVPLSSNHLKGEQI